MHIFHPLRIKQQYLFELENNLLLYYTDTSRDSGKINEQQAKNVTNKKESSIDAMHQLKLQALMMNFIIAFCSPIAMYRRCVTELMNY